MSDLLQQQILGKRGSSYTIAEITAILNHFGITPNLYQWKRDLLAQLQELERDRRLTRAQRLRLNLDPRRAARAVEVQSECTVCFEMFTADGMPESRITRTCDHEATLCRGCLSQHITTALSEGRWNRITCPECPEVLSFHDVQKFASRESFER